MNRRMVNLKRVVLVLLVLALLLPMTEGYAQGQEAERWVEEGDRLLFQSNFAGAEEAYEAAIAANPDDARAYAHRCYLHTFQKLFEEAIADCEQAIALAPDDAEGYIYLTRAYDWNQQFEQAIEIGKRAIDLAPESGLAHSFLGEAYINLARSEMVKTKDNPVFESISKLLDNNIEIGSQSVKDIADIDAEFVFRNLRAGKAAYDLALKFAPDSAEVHRNLAFMYGELERNKDILITLQTSDSPVPDFILEESGKEMIFLSTALKLEPDFLWYHQYMGHIRYMAEQYDQAIDSYQQASSIARQVGNREEQAKSLYSIAGSYSALGQDDKALSSYEEALTIFKEIDHKLGQAGSLMELMETYINQNEVAKAMCYYDETRDALLEALEGSTDEKIKKLNSMIEAVGNWPQLLMEDEELPDEIDPDMSLCDMARIYEDLIGGFLEDMSAIENTSVIKDIPIIENIPAREDISLIEDMLQLITKDFLLMADGATSYQEGKYDTALSYFDQTVEALDEMRKNHPFINTDMGKLQGLIFSLKGQIYYQKGQYQKALDAYEQALNSFPIPEIDTNILSFISLMSQNNIFAECGEAVMRCFEAATLNNLGQVYARTGLYKKALEQFDDALAISQEVGAQSVQGITLSNIGAVYYEQGRYKKALESALEGLELYQDANNKFGQAVIQNNIGVVYHSLGEYEDALNYIERAMSIAEELNRPALIVQGLNNMGLIYGSLEQYEKALDSYKEALGISPEKGFLGLGGIGLAMPNEGEILLRIGMVYQGMEQQEKALAYYEQAHSASKKIGDNTVEILALLNIGFVNLQQMQFEEAQDYFRLALTRAQEVGDQHKQLIAQAWIGVIYERQGDIFQAINYYQQAAQNIESMQGDLKVEELKTSFIDGVVEVHEQLINLLWKEGRFENAFRVAEQARARAFLERFANGTVDYRAGHEADLLQEGQALREEITFLRAQLQALHDPPRNEWDLEAIHATESEVQALEEEFSRFQRDLQIQSSEVASLVSVDVAELAEIQRLLDADTTLVEYFVLKERTLAFVITHDSLQPVPLDVTRDQLAETINNFRKSDLSDPFLSDFYPSSLQQLHSWLMVPLKAHLNTSTVGIVPHNVLHYLPFAALTDGERFLSDEYVLFSLPSASMLRFLPEKRKANAETILALGNPTIETSLLASLPYAAQEAKTVGDLYGTQALTNGAATESAVWSQASQAGILHLAAHGQYNLDNPLFSTIHLAPDDSPHQRGANDGRLEVHEIYGLDLTSTTDLVVLSACNTQEGKMSSGDEVVALNRAFLYAGSPTVIASLWNVEDQATGLLMEHFYTHLRAGMGKAQALQQAQQALRANETYGHPYYWAGFTLVGDKGQSEPGAEDIVEQEEGEVVGKDVIGEAPQEPEVSISDFTSQVFNTLVQDQERDWFRIGGVVLVLVISLWRLRSRGGWKISI